MANSVESDETARYNPSHLILHSFLQKYMIWSEGLKELTLKPPVTTIVVCFVICLWFSKSFLQTVWTQLLSYIWTRSTLFACMQK